MVDEGGLCERGWGLLGKTYTRTENERGYERVEGQRRAGDGEKSKKGRVDGV